MQCTDLSNVDLLVKAHGEHMRFVPEWGKWLIWDGHRWRTDITGQIIRWMSVIVRKKYYWSQKWSLEPNITDNEREKRRAVHEWWRRSGSTAKLHAIERLARSYEGIPVGYEELDQKPDLLNLKNGTFDLKTGELRDHSPDDLLTKMARVEFDPDVVAPRWDKFIDEVLCGDKELIEFVRRIFGYALTGHTHEQCYFFLHGFGCNGKSTLVNVIHHMLGDYSQTCAPNLFVTNGGDAHPTGVARLCGARFVASTEIEGKDKRLAEQLLKQVTGGEAMVARRMREDFWEFTPTLKLFLSANSLPHIEGSDHGTWRRIHKIPFNLTIPEEDRDSDLLYILETYELSGIFNWIFQGCQDWYRAGLQPPECSKEETKKWRGICDPLEGYLEEATAHGKSMPEQQKDQMYAWLDVDKDNEKKSIPVSDFQTGYRSWLKSNGLDVVGGRKISGDMEAKGFTKDRVTARSQTRYAWLGIEAISLVPKKEPAL
jgi:putative DNA primase/helicase